MSTFLSTMMSDDCCSSLCFKAGMPAATSSSSVRLVKYHSTCEAAPWMSMSAGSSNAETRQGSTPLAAISF